MKNCLLVISVLFFAGASAQETSDSIPHADTSLRIVNFSPYFTQNVDSVFVYQFAINKNPRAYYWYLKDVPVGLSIGKDNGVVRFRAAKNYFLSGRMQYDFPYKVHIGVQSLANPQEKVDSFFTIRFYNTEIIASKLKPTVAETVTVEEGETITFDLQCETGSFPFETILFNSSIPLSEVTAPAGCGGQFRWSPPFDFVKETDPGPTKTVLLNFVGLTKFQMRDTTTVRLIVKDALNYPLALETYSQVYKNVQNYILQLKFSFLQLDSRLRKIKGTRLAFDLSSGTTALTGTILNTSADEGAQRAGKILPSIGLALTPIKEAAAGNKPVEQNQAAMIRSSIKRLEYMLQDNLLVGEKDAEILRKTQKLREELKQVQVQLIDIPVDIPAGLSEAELNEYFNSPKVNKKYRLK